MSDEERIAELEPENAALKARVTRLENVVRQLSEGLPRTINDQMTLRNLRSQKVY